MGVGPGRWRPGRQTGPRTGRRRRVLVARTARWVGPASGQSHVGSMRRRRHVVHGVVEGERRLDWRRWSGARVDRRRALAVGKALVAGRGHVGQLRDAQLAALVIGFAGRVVVHHVPLGRQRRAVAVLLQTSGRGQVRVAGQGGGARRHRRHLLDGQTVLHAGYCRIVESARKKSPCMNI